MTNFHSIASVGVKISDLTFFSAKFSVSEIYKRLTALKLAACFHYTLMVNEATFNAMESIMTPAKKTQRGLSGRLAWNMATQTHYYTESKDYTSEVSHRAPKDAVEACVSMALPFEKTIFTHTLRHGVASYAINAMKANVNDAKSVVMSSVKVIEDHCNKLDKARLTLKIFTGTVVDQKLVTLEEKAATTIEEL